jgi:hypothetical protein
MTTIGDYLSYILKEVTTARKMADAETLVVAQAYAEDELLRYFPVPKFRLDEVNFSIPLSISKAEYAQKAIKTISQESLTQIYEEESQAYLSSRKSSIKIINNPEFNWLRETVLSAHNDIQKYDETEVLKRLGDYSHKVFWELSQWVKVDDKNVEDFAYAIEQKIKGRTNVLEKILISPESNIIRDETGDKSVFVINAKVREEGIYINSIKNPDGSITKTVNFE